MDDQSSEFLGAFNAIEDWLKQQLNAAPDAKFHELVISMARSHPGVKRHEHLLKKFGWLRNLVAHEYRPGKPMTVPTPHTVERIVAIRDELLSPPSLLAVSNKPVVMCGPTDPIGKATKKMHDGSFSQLPVYDDGSFVELLTAETVARWLASQLASGDGILLEMSVAEVQKHQEDPENYAFLGRASTVLDGLAAFDAFLHKGKRLEAVILTNNGKPTEQPLGIVTVHDIPKMRRALRE